MESDELVTLATYRCRRCAYVTHDEDKMRSHILTNNKCGSMSYYDSSLTEG